MSVWLAAGLLILSGARVLYLSAAFEFGSQSVHRYHVEAAVVVFFTVGIALKLFRRREPALTWPAWAPPLWLWPIFIAAAICLYWPALHMGYLSDDFDLQRLAREWRVGAVTASLFRPIPMSLWGLLQAAGAGPPATHLLNIVLHGTNAFLITRICSRWPMPSSAAVFAGAAALTNPLALEPVVWCSGLFDLSATAVVLLLVLQGRQLSSAGLSRRVLFVATACIAVLCKETAVVGVVLVFVDLWVLGALNLRLVRGLAALLVVSGMYAAVRIAHAGEAPTYALTRNIVRRATFVTFGGYAAPWHFDNLVHAPWLPFAWGVVVVIGLGIFFLSRRGGWPLFLGAGVWILTCIAPIFRAVLVSSDLQTSRYLYLGACAWFGFIAHVFMASSPSAVRRALTMAGIAFLAVSGWSTRTGLRHWQDAAVLRDRVIDAVRDDPAFVRCAALTLREMPDNVRGAYLFRVGMPDAVMRGTGKPVIANASPDCTLTWEPARQAFVRAASESRVP